MQILTLLFTGIGLSIDSLVASLTAGAVTKRIGILTMLKVAFVFAIFQGGMPIFGWLLGSSFKNIIENFDHWVAFILLLGIGGKMIYEGIRQNDKDRVGFNFSSNLFLMCVGLATSIDALIVGIGFGLLSVNIWIAISIIGITTFIFSLSGILLGKKLGNSLNKSIEIFGGIILIGLGLKILLSHTI